MIELIIDLLHYITVRPERPERPERPHCYKYHIRTDFYQVP